MMYVHQWSLGVSMPLVGASPYEMPDTHVTMHKLHVEEATLCNTTPPGLWSSVRHIVYGRSLTVLTLLFWAASGVIALANVGVDTCHETPCPVVLGDLPVATCLSIYGACSVTLAGALVLFAIVARCAPSMCWSRIDWHALVLAVFGALFRIVAFGIGSVLYWRSVAPGDAMCLIVWAIECSMIGVWFLLILFFAVFQMGGKTVTFGRFC